MRTPWLASILLVLGAALSCSVLNAPEDLLTGPPGGGGGNAGDSGDGGSSGDSGTGSGGGSGGDSPFVPEPPTTGLLVLAAQDGDGARVLSVLSTEDGSELHREDLPVAALAYDGAPGRYLWFVFKAADYPAHPTKLADLEVRQFDDARQQWVVVSTATALPPPRPDTLVVLNQRLAYLSYVVEASTPMEALTVLDTSDLDEIRLLGTSRLADAGESFVGLAGVRGSDVNPKAKGGTLSLMIASACLDAIGGGPADGPGPDVSCDLFAQPIFVANDLMEGVGNSLGTFEGWPHFASSRTDGRVFAIFHAEAGPEMIAFPPNSPVPTSQVPIGTVTGEIGGFAVLECESSFVLTQVDEQELSALRFIGLKQTLALGHPGGLVYADPFDSLVFSLPPSDGDPEAGLGAYEVRGANLSSGAPPAVADWEPPSDLIFLTGTTRYPDTMSCD